MTKPFACLFALLAVLAQGGTMRAEPAADASPYVEILVDGAARPRYAHRGRWYVEAAKGQEYAIRLRNPYPVRVAVALSVDGLNTIDARETTAREARKWVLGPFETVTIRGWQTSRTEARRFEFTTEERSYGEALGKTANLGVISAVFFKERPPIAYLHREPARERADASAGTAAEAPAAPAPPATSVPEALGQLDRQSAARAEANEYAATGMGRRTGNAVTQVYLDLEEQAAASVDVRYEFRPQLVRLGIVPPHATGTDTLRRRERARGFEPGFSPAPPAWR